jgi:Tfp pilus assembly protein PilV
MEVMVALTILTIGLMAGALLMANVYKSTARSRYMAMAAALATEKLEDLSRFPNSDPRGSNPGGSLDPNNPQAAQTVTWNSVTYVVPYYDTVTYNNSNGAMAETYQVLYSGATNFTTQQFTADGLWHWDTTSGYPSTPSSTAPTGGLTFKRLWKIDADTPVTGNVLVTVKVVLVQDASEFPVVYQMSMVRPSAT